MLDEHMKAPPQRPRVTPLFLMLKGDPASVAEANRRIAAGETDHHAHGGEVPPLLFDFDDVLYLFAPVVWLGWQMPLMAGAALGAPAFAVLTWFKWRTVRRSL